MRRVPRHQMLAVIDDMDVELRPQFLEQGRALRRVGAVVAAVDHAQRHLKLGDGALSDVEWLVQLIQLQHASEVVGLRTTSTLRALDAAVAADLVPADGADRLREAWRLASRLRSAITLLTGQTSDVLPSDRRQLDGIGRLLGYPDRSATEVEEDYLGVTRRARRVFEELFYG